MTGTLHVNDNWPADESFELDNSNMHYLMYLLRYLPV